MSASVADRGAEAIARWARGSTFIVLGAETEEGLSRAELHPNLLNIGRSTWCLGSVDWPLVWLLALEADASGQLPVARATFRRCQGKQTLQEPASEARFLRLLSDTDSLHTAYAALLTDRLMEICYCQHDATARDVSLDRCGGCGAPTDTEHVLPSWWSQHRGSAEAADDADAPIIESMGVPDAAWAMDVYCVQAKDAADCPEGPLGVLQGRRPDPGKNESRELGLIDPRALRTWRWKIKPNWPKAWAYAKCMAAGDVFPPVKIAWHSDTMDWRFRDGCHRYFGALVSQTLMPVSYKVPQWPPDSETACPKRGGDD